MVNEPRPISSLQFGKNKKRPIHTQMCTYRPLCLNCRIYLLIYNTILNIK